MSVDCGDEYNDVDSETRVRARKEHTCHACKETIERTHFYVRHVMIFDRNVSVTIRCLRCDAIYQGLVKIHRENNELQRQKARAGDYSGSEESVWPDVALNCGHEFKERWGREPPEELARLAFMTPAELQAEAAAKAGTQ